MNQYPYRKRSVACIHPETYKYFLDPTVVENAWQRLEQRYGRPKRNEAFRTIEVETPHLFLRAVVGGNPITVIRKRGCPSHAIDTFHEAIQFTPPTTTLAMPVTDIKNLAPVAVLVTDDEQRVVEVSERFYSIFGCEESAVLGLAQRPTIATTNLY